MPNQIKHVSELPHWFKLDKYNQTKKMDAASWYEQLYVRYNTKLALQRLLENLDDYDEEYDDEADIDLVDNTIAKIENNPIIDISSDLQLTEDFCFNALQEFKEKMPVYTLGIHKMTVGELLYIEHAAGKKLQKIKKRERKEYLLEIRGYDIPDETWRDKPLYELNRSPL